jgi:hypothetical protein
MTVIEIPTVLLWLLIGLFVANGAATLYVLWLRRKLLRLRAEVLNWKPRDPGCWCARCDMEHNVKRTRMSVCPECGDKRCPRAEDHRNKCGEVVA